MSEADHQEAFFNWLAFHPAVRPFCFAIPNGGYRNKWEAASLRRQGVTAGIPDVFCSIPARGYHGLYIEFKFGKNKQTPAQANLFELFMREGYRCQVVYAWEDARELLIDYLDGRLT